MRGDTHNYLNLAADYSYCGLFEEAIEVTERLITITTDPVNPMVHYTLGYLYGKLGQQQISDKHLKLGSQADSEYCFPNHLFDLTVLQSVIEVNPDDDKASYYLGNLLYDKKRPSDAIAQWEASRAINAAFATVHRNLALAYYNKMQDSQAALQSLQKAFECNRTDARVFYELDQLYKKLGHSPEQRFANLEQHKELVAARDDLYLEYVTLLNKLGRHEQATDALASRMFHPWEGGEGKVTGQYVLAHVEMGKKFLQSGQHELAAETYKKALVYPNNLGEGKLAGAQENNIFYHLGCAYEKLNDADKALECFAMASQGLEEPASAMFYNDQPPDMIFYQGLAWLKLNNNKEASRRFNKLIDYAEKHMFDDVKIDYFAVSLPDFLVFEDDLNKRNEIHCRYMMALGMIGLQNTMHARSELEEVLRLDPNHQGALVHLGLC